MYLTQGLRRAAQIRSRGKAIKDGDRQWTWAEVLERVSRAAGMLRTLGLRKGDRAAVLSLNNAQYFNLLFAVPWAGGSVVPLNTRLIAAEIDYILEDSGASFLFVDKTFAPLLASL
jgi:long-chain acyl-CoA synthetase